MDQIEQTLAAIFRHCDEVAEGKRPPRTEKEGREAARAWLGANAGVSVASTVLLASLNHRNTKNYENRILD